jgi:zinc protease
MWRSIAMLACASALAWSPGSAQDPARVAFETYPLSNGLTVILAPEHSAQVVEVNVWYHVGSRNEARGRTGFAHLFEHMMFQGSANVAKAQHSALVARAGGINNGNTTEDRTGYYETLPSNRLNLGIWLEADHMRSLAVTSENFENQRQAVKEERRLRVDNQPYATAIFEDAYLAFDSATCFPYSHSVIGSMTDLDAATVADAQAFNKLYYAPNNATLTVVGDFDPAEAKALIQRFFGDIPRGAPPPAVVCEQRFNTGAIRKAVRDDKANLPATFHIYRVPEYRNPDYPAIDLLATIIGQGESSRLNRTLAREQKSAVQTFVFLNPFGPRNGPGGFLAGAIANQGVALDTLDAQLAVEIAKVASAGVTEAELSKAKSSYRANVITGRQSVANVADALQTAGQFLGSPEAINSEMSRYAKVTAADVQRVASTYLRPENVLVLLVSAGAKP